MAYIRRTGDWTKAHRLLRRSRYLQIVTRAPQKILGKAALILERQIKKGLRNGTLNLAPLSIYTIMEKEDLGYSLEPLVRTGEMLRSVTTIRKQGYIFIGVPRGVAVHNYAGNHDVENIAETHHFGKRKNLPARPFITNAYEQVSDEVQRLVVEAAKKAFLGF